MSIKILVAYASISGSTGEVAEAIGEILAQGGVTVEVKSVRAVTDLNGYDAVVLGSSIRAGRWLPEAVRFLDHHRAELAQLPVAYFTMCLTMVDDSEENRRIVLAYMEPLLLQAPEIKPVGLGLFAGSLDPTRAVIMPTKGVFQGDYRNWAVIKAWAEEIRPRLLSGAGASEPVVLHGAILRYADMSQSDLPGANLQGADLHGADLHASDLRNANLSETNLVKADLREADLNEARLQKAGLNWADLKQADLKDADLSRANLMGADLSHARLGGADLSQAVLNGANLSYADLSQADLTSADLNWVDLRGANLNQANLSRANLGWANLSETDLSQTNLSRARYNAQTHWPENFSPETQDCIFFSIE